MPSSTERLSAIVQQFVAGQPFWEFWRAFTNFLHANPEPPDFSPAEQADYEALYELVYMGQPDPVPPADRVVGLIGERALRERLRHSRWASPAVGPS